MAAPAASHGPRRSGHAGGVTTKIGFSIIILGFVLLFARALNWIDAEAADIASVLMIVVGALAVAIDGEEADESTNPRRRND